MIILLHPPIPVDKKYMDDPLSWKQILAKTKTKTNEVLKILPFLDLHQIFLEDQV